MVGLHTLGDRIRVGPHGEYAPWPRQARREYALCRVFTAIGTGRATYFQDSATVENTSCMGCHYGASDTDYSWVVKLRTFPQPYDQGRILPIATPTN